MMPPNNLVTDDKLTSPQVLVIAIARKAAQMRKVRRRMLVLVGTQLIVDCGDDLFAFEDEAAHLVLLGFVLCSNLRYKASSFAVVGAEGYTKEGANRYKKVQNVQQLVCAAVV